MAGSLARNAAASRSALRRTLPSAGPPLQGGKEDFETPEFLPHFAAASKATPRGIAKQTASAKKKRSVPNPSMPSHRDGPRPQDVSTATRTRAAHPKRATKIATASAATPQTIARANLPAASKAMLHVAAAKQAARAAGKRLISNSSTPSPAGTAPVRAGRARSSPHRAAAPERATKNSRGEHSDAAPAAQRAANAARKSPIQKPSLPSRPSGTAPCASRAARRSVPALP